MPQYRSRRREYGEASLDVPDGAVLALAAGPESALGAGAGVVEVVVVVPGSVVVVVGVVAVVGSVVVVVGSVLVVVVDGSELGGAVLVAGVGGGVDVVVVAVEAAPALPAAATVGVVDCASTVASVWVCVRPGGTLGLVLASALPVAGPVALAGFLAVVEAFLAGAALCACLTGSGWVTTETPPVTWCVVVVVVTVGCAGTDATALDVAM